MTDVLTPEQRRRNMSSIKGRNTKPEMLVRSMIHRMGYRYRLHRSDLPGKPDLVFPGRRKIVLVHGCFWHMHNCRYGNVVPKTNAEFWQKKRSGNVERDKVVLEQLEHLGWKVFTVWECWTRDKELLQQRVTEFLES